MALCWEGPEHLCFLRLPGDLPGSQGGAALGHLHGCPPSSHLVHGVLGEQSIRQGDERDGASQQLVSTHGGRAPCRVDTRVHSALLLPCPTPVRRVLKDPHWMEADLRSQGERRDAVVRGW